ncbi:hypothetical protein SAMN05192534_104123 [Alteribacillus persepolensis]|uniref:Phosphoesterase n=1 Tax=Alteribacillus persepolensis TaxID=568899 RepID=A0A1G8BQ84_9BACI|nr:metallophosphoesterase [Alteribacillus persepolensis]SDH35228.1 hypothetical protein SAMN05192534_104123 [Alteribacillus persepolensis]
MQCLIMSDSHGAEKEVAEVIERHVHEVDAMIHCGDSELPATSPVLKDVYVVEGNCDRPGAFAEDRAEDINGIRVYVTHGHLYNVKMTRVPLSYRAEEKAARLACFGHSHIAEAFTENGVVYVNPGSLLLPRNRPEQTYAIAQFDKGGQATVRFFERESGQRIHELEQTFSLS